jgi:ORF6N domain
MVATGLVSQPHRARVSPNPSLTSPHDEWAALRSQSATLNAQQPGGRGQHRKYLPYVFTEHGAIMAANLLSSPRAIEVSVYVVRASSAPHHFPRR